MSWEGAYRVEGREGRRRVLERADGNVVAESKDKQAEHIVLYLETCVQCFIVQADRHIRGLDQLVHREHTVVRFRNCFRDLPRISTVSPSARTTFLGKHDKPSGSARLSR